MATLQFTQHHDGMGPVWRATALDGRYYVILGWPGHPGWSARVYSHAPGAAKLPALVAQFDVGESEDVAAVMTRVQAWADENEAVRP